MRGPGRPSPRRPLSDADIGALLGTAELRLLEAHANHASDRVLGALHRAEQDLLLVRLAADTGARRGELAALQITDLEGRVLNIERALSAGILTTPKSGRGRSDHPRRPHRRVVATAHHDLGEPVASAPGPGG